MLYVFTFKANITAVQCVEFKSSFLLRYHLFQYKHWFLPNFKLKDFPDLTSTPCSTLKYGHLVLLFKKTTLYSYMYSFYFTAIKSNVKKPLENVVVWVAVRFLERMTMELDFSSHPEMILNENAMWPSLHFRTKCPILDMAKVSLKKPLLQSKIAEFFSHLQWWENNFYQPNGPKVQYISENSKHL